MKIDAMTEGIRIPRPDRGRIAGLLRRYPDISPMETEEIVTFIKTARHLDVGLLTTDNEVRPRLDAFMEDHKRHFQANVPEAVLIAAAVAAALVVIVLIEMAVA